MKINIDKQIDNNKCPCGMWCVIATTGLEPQERENTCYHCWKDYCKENNIEITYGEEDIL